MKRIAFACAGMCLVVAAASAQQTAATGDQLCDEFDPARYLQARALTSVRQVTPGGRFYLAVELNIADHWVYYSPDPGPIVLPGKIEVAAGPLESGEVLWPEDKPKTTAFADESIVNNVYTGKTIIYVPISVPPDVPLGKYEISVLPAGQICQAVCLDVQGIRAQAVITVALEDEVNPLWSEELSEGLSKAMTVAQLKTLHAGPVERKIASVQKAQADRTLWAGLGLALLAGLTLNIMPCVLPVIPLRILSIVQMAGQSRRRFVTLGLAFAGGMILFFAGLAVVSAVIRLATGQALNVSDHFTYPGVRIAMAMVLVALAANLFGVFNVVVPARVASIEGKSRREGHVKSAGMGMMMAILATPCSFAYLLGAMAWAQLQPLWLGTMALLTIGVGMALPHFLLCAFPGLVDKLPRPGRWMELFKQGMGFLLLPVAIWLISTLGEETWPFWVAAYGVVLTVSLWIWANWVRYDATAWRKMLIRGLAVAVAVGGGLVMLPKHGSGATQFQDFSEKLLETGRQDGRVVLVKVTAAWCTECLVIDHAVYNAPEIAEEIIGRNVLAMKADVTDHSRAASKWLRREFGAAPPITIIYPLGGGSPISLVGGFSKADLLASLDLAGMTSQGN